MTPSTVGGCWASARWCSSATYWVEVGAVDRGGQFLGQFDQAEQRLPAAARGAARGRVGGEAEGREQLAHRRRAGRPRRRGRDRDAQRVHGLAHFLPGEEPFAAAHQVRDVGLGERLLVDLGLGVDPEQDRDLARGHAPVEQLPDPARDGGGLGGFVVELGEARFRSWLALADQLQPRPGRTVPRRADDPVGQADDLAGWSGSRVPAGRRRLPGSGG